jgi:2'-5' RNA ligase
MPYLVIAYPTLSQQDRQWMQQVREQHDTELASVVAPHFTLVFPLVVLEAKQLIEHVKAQVEHWQHIPFVLRCALPIKDALSEEISVFLVPEEGFSAIVKLHDALYRGVLASELRLDIPFLPHITVGKTSDPWQAKALADQLNQQSPTIHGLLETLDVITYEKMTVQTLERIPLLSESG